jgi:hypothetical protein
MVHRTDLEGTVTVLVLNLPKGLKAVNKEDSGPWKKTDEELFSVALENLKSTAKPKIVEHDVGGAKRVAVLGEEMFSSSRCLLLEEHPSTMGKFGSFVVVPSRQVILTVPINDRRALNAAKAIINLAIQWNASDPGPISTNLYWYEDHRFTPIPYERHNDDLHLKPPTEVFERFNKVPEASTLPAK